MLEINILDFPYPTLQNPQTNLKQEFFGSRQ